jgi:hypothetical protein
MGNWSLSGNNFAVDGYPVPSNYFVALTSGSANVKGGWVELISSTPYFGTLYMTHQATNSLSKDSLFDLGIGAAGSELIIVNNLLFSSLGGASYTGGQLYSLPLSVPSGARIAVRVQSSASSVLHNVSAGIIGVSDMRNGICFQSCATYGAVTEDSGGTSIDPGGSANTKGAWVELTSATTSYTQGFFLAFGNKCNAARADASMAIDVGVGAAGLERPIVQNFIIQAGSAMDSITPRVSPFFYVGIPTGTRISARSACSITDATDRLIDIVLYCIN